MMKTFFNKKQKSDFLDKELGFLTEKEKSVYIYTFRKICTVEEMLEKDVSDFTLQELVNLFEQLNWTHHNSFKTRRSILQKYVVWVKQQDEKSLPIGMLKYEYLKGSLGLSIYNFKDIHELKECLDYIYDECGDINKEKYHNRKVVWYLAWYGFTQEEIQFLKKCDVDAENNIIKSSISDYVVKNIDEDVMRFLNEFKDSKGHEREHYGNFIFKKYVNNNYLVRNTVYGSIPESDPINLSGFLSRVSREWNKLVGGLPPSNKFYGKKLVYSHLFDSGCFDRLFNLEQRGTDITEDDYAAISKVARIESNIKYYKSGKKFEYNIKGADVYKKYLKWRKFYYNK